MMGLPWTASAISAETGPESAAVPAAKAEVPAEAQLEFAPFQDQAFVEARRSGQPLVLYFEADWCVPCKEMHAKTFRSPAVVEAAAGFRLFRVDLTEPDTHRDRVRKSFRVIGAPTVVLFGPDGKERAHRFGFIPADDFVEMLGKTRGPAESSRLDVVPACLAGHFASRRSC